MLNELYKLSEALEKYGLLQTTTHPNINAVVREASLLIEIDKTGVARGSRLLNADETAKLWRHSRGNHHSFPAIRMQEPLLAETECAKLAEVSWENLKLSEKLDRLRKLDFTKANPDCSRIKIGKWSLGELTFDAEPDYPELSALEQLIKTFPNDKNYPKFLKSLLSFFSKKLPTTTNESEVDMIKKLIVGDWNEAQQKYIVGSMTYYDVYEVEQFPNVVASTATRTALVKLLTEQDEAEYAKGTRVNSPLSGIKQPALTIKYPNPNLPLLGQTYLYSKKEDTSCLTRYGTSGIEAFQIGRQESNAMNNALSFLTKPERKGITWLAARDCRRDKPNLLLAYLADDPANDALLAQAIADPSAYETQEEQLEELESLFETLCKQVLGSTEEQLRKNPNSKVNLIMLESLDPGRKQVVYTRYLSLKQLRENLLTWQQASENTPQLLPLLTDRKMNRPKTIGPNEIIRLSKINYLRSGRTQFNKQSFTSLNEVYELYMPQAEITIEEKAFIRTFLDNTLTATGQLLADVGHLQTVNYNTLTRTQRDALLRNAKSTISLISILLWHLDIRKENYVNSYSFNVGQLLQLADKLHKEYCKVVRNKGGKSVSYPPRFIGGEMLPIALSNPTEGLQRLSERMPVYTNWAQTSVGEDKGLAKHFLNQIGEVSYLIANDLVPEEYGPQERAQLFLGYLANVPKKSKEAKTTKEEA